jgi:glucose-6-phosphate 1-dehydrogenase
MKKHLAHTSEAYERLLLDCIQGYKTLFTRNDEVLEQWRYVSRIINAWGESPIRKLLQYPAGTWGAEAA